MRASLSARKVVVFGFVMVVCLLGSAGLTIAKTSAAHVGSTGEGSGAKITKTFTWSESGDADTLDPYSHYEVTTLTLIGNMCEPLILKDPKSSDLKFKPCLATKWEQTAPKIWTFDIRQGVKFHDGTPFTVADVLFSIKRAKHQDSDFKGALSNIDKAIEVAPFKVEIHTKEIDPILPNVLVSFFMMSESWCKKHGTENPGSLAASGGDNYASRHVNGTGPFKLVSRDPDVKTVLEVNTDWWDTPEHNIKQAIYRPIQNDSTRTAALLSNEVDLMYPVPIQDISRVEKAPEAALKKQDGLFVVLLEMNQADDSLHADSTKGKNPFKDIRVRQAVYHAIDIKAIQRKIMRGLSNPIGILYAKGTNGYNAADDVRLPYDLDKAKALMKEAGYAQGFAVDFYCPTDRYVNDEKIATAISAMLSKIGIKLNIHAQTKSKFFQDVFGLKADMNLFGWVPSTYDAFDALNALAATRKPGYHGEYNQGRYSNSEYDQLVSQIRSEMDPEKRNQMISKASEILKSDVANVPLHSQALVYGANKKINFNIRPDGFFYLRDLYIKD